VEERDSRTNFVPNTTGYSYRKDKPPMAKCLANEQHRFLMVTFSCPFLAKQLAAMGAMLHPIVCAPARDCQCQLVPGSSVRLTASQQQIVGTIRHPPVYALAQPLRHQRRALPLAVMFLLQLPPEKEMFCTRRHAWRKSGWDRTFFC
jgi:hypothetical protein